MRARWMALSALRLVALVAWGLVAGCEDKVPEPEGRPASTAPKPPKDEGPKELQKEDLKVGEGPVAETGDTVKVHYTGRLLATNAKFDSSRDRDEPFEFTLGKGAVIEGWDKGVVGMKVGGERKLTIPSDLAYGKKGSPPKIPPDAPLVFEVELVEVVGKEADEEEPAGEDADKEAAGEDDKEAAGEDDKEAASGDAEEEAAGEE